MGHCLLQVLSVLRKSVFYALKFFTVAPSKSSQSKKCIRDPYHRMQFCIYYHKGRGVSATV